MEDFLTVFQMIGTAAFAISGAITAVHAGLDLFGIIALGVMTATAGGVIRDIILGIFPPIAFVNSMYVLTAALISVVVFLIARDEIRSGTSMNNHSFRVILLLGDSIGLGVFTTAGMYTAITRFSADNGFLVIFSGVVTGVGGGFLRDISIHALPEIFSKHVYAVASIAGALISLYLFRHSDPYTAIYIGTGIIVLIRLLAARYRWSLPRVQS